MVEQIAQGSWELQSTENFDEYMKTVGVGYAKRLIGNRAKPKQQITVENGTWTITTSTTISKVVISFQLNEQFEETTADGRKVQTTFSVEGNKLVQTQKGDVDSVITREFDKDSFIMTLEAGKVVCTRHYQRASS